MKDNSNTGNFDEKNFEILFKTYFVPLSAYARKFIHDIDTVKEIVHDVFIRLWEKRDTIDTNKSIKSYLYTSVHNRCLNYIRDNKKFDKENIDMANISANTNKEETDKLVEAELESKIKNAIDSLPERCKEIFVLNRFDELKYKEVAVKLNISVKTVEAQMSKALKILKEKLAEYLYALLFILLQYFD